MRKTSRLKTPHTRFATIRRQLLWSYGVLIFIILAMVVSFAWLFLDYYERVDELLSMNAATATITIKLEDTHQLLENTINYEDPAYIRPFLAKRGDLENYVRQYDALALRTADLLNDYDAYYQFLEIQEYILVYAIESDILLDLFGEGVKRFELYNKLYSLRDLNYRTYQLQSALLVRQNNFLGQFYEEYGPVVQRRFVLLLGLTVLFVAFSIFWTLRQASTISRPLNQLVKMNLALAGGQFDAVKPLRTSNDELMTLSDAFTFMAEKLSESMATEKKSLLLESSLKQARLETLQAQINPHFLFNALNTVRSLSQMENARQTEAIIDALAAFLRYTLESLESNVTLADEFTMAENYLTIQKMRYGHRLNYSISLDPELAGLRLPSLLIQPLLENAIVHGIEPLKSGGTVTLTGRREIVDGTFRPIIEVADDGTGMDEEIRRKLKEEMQGDLELDGIHVGIRNTWRRLILTDPNALMVFLPNPEGPGTLIRIVPSFRVPE